MNRNSVAGKEQTPGGQVRNWPDESSAAVRPVFGCGCGWCQEEAGRARAREAELERHRRAERLTDFVMWMVIFVLVGLLVAQIVWQGLENTAR